MPGRVSVGGWRVGESRGQVVPGERRVPWPDERRCRTMTVTRGRTQEARTLETDGDGRETARYGRTQDGRTSETDGDGRETARYGRMQDARTRKTDGDGREAVRT